MAEMENIYGEGQKKESSFKGQPLCCSLEKTPCAAYLVRQDSDFTILGGNESFFRLFGCTEIEMQYKNGNRLGAMLDPTSSKELYDQIQKHCKKQGDSIQLEQTIRRQDGTSAWIYTAVSCLDIEGETALYAVSFDISSYKELEKTFRDYQSMMQFLTARTHLEVFSYNVESQTAHVYNAGPILDALSSEEKEICPNFVETFLSKIAVYPEYENAFRTAVRNVQQEGTCSVCEIRIKDGQGRDIWARFSIERTTWDSRPGEYAVGVLENITQQKEAALTYLTEAQFYQAMLSEKDAYGHVDITENKITRVGGMWNLYNEIIDSISYSQLVEEFIFKVVYPEDRQHYLEVMQRSNFEESFQNGVDRLGCQFRRIVEQNKMMWMELNVHLFRDPFSHHLLALLYIKNIDAVKKRELSAVHEPGDPACGAPKKTSPSVPASQTSISEFDSFVGVQGDMAYLVDPTTFDLICGNQAFYDRIGLSPAQCQGMKCYEAVQKRQTPCPFCGKANWSTDKYYLWKNLNTGLEQEFLIKNKLVSWKGAEALLALSVDISNDKSIVDSLENSATESHSVLGGIQRMVEASNLTISMNSAMETIGAFFRADGVEFWERKNRNSIYECTFLWHRAGANMANPQSMAVKGEMNEWLQNREWSHPILVENQESMLCHSFDMYQYMKRNDIENQRWVPLLDGEREVGCLLIENTSINFQNVSFMESFSVFIISELKKRSMMENILYSSSHDELTHLFNRASYEKFLQNYDNDQFFSLGVAMVNINDLKAVNNTYGFQTGDYFIKQLANMLRRIFPDNDIFRLNGDEFLTIATNLKWEEMEKKIVDLEKSVHQNGRFTVSLGHSWDDVEKDLPLEVERATQTMKINKKRYYDSMRPSDDTERHNMLLDLRKSLENQEFEVFLQPKVDIFTQKMVGAEALIRYYHKELGIISPAKFIDILERNNFIRYIDLFVLETVCQLLEKWRREGKKRPVISLNFSRLTLLENDILSSVETILSKYDMCRKEIEIEITESLGDMGKGVLYQAAQDLYKAGFSISLDDFGTKYTNLSILADIDFDMLKLDKSLIHTLEKQKSNQIILKNIISMCDDLHIEVIAEGVETKEQENILRDLGCHLGQGYLYGKPMPIPDFEKKYMREDDPFV